jgi:hypothetical protein
MQMISQDRRAHDMPRYEVVDNKLVSTITASPSQIREAHAHSVDHADASEEK